MRWGERTAGELVAVAVLVVGFLVASAPGEAMARVRPGMTQAEVEAALGTPGRPDAWKDAALHAPRDLSDLWSPESIERERSVRREEHRAYRSYDLSSCVVAVAFHGAEGDERVTSVEAYRVLRPGWSLVPWAVGAVVAGLVTVYMTRRYSRRPVVAAEPTPAEVGAS